MVLRRSFVASWFFVLAVSVIVRSGETRNWIDNRGNQVPGELVEVTADDQVVLLVGGEKVSIPFAVFSESDQAFLREQTKATEASPLPEEESLSEPEMPESVASEPPVASEAPEEEDGAEAYVPPRYDYSDSLVYFCSGCDGELPADLELGDACPHCFSVIHYTEDENGNVTEGTKPPWFSNLPIRGIGFLVFLVLSTAWKFRRYIPVG